MNIDPQQEAILNRKIEEQLEHDMEVESQIIKLLLLGAGDSGKTTLRKQMRNLFGSGFTKEMRDEFAPVILNLLFTGFEDIIMAMQYQLQLEFKNEESARAAEKILDAMKIKMICLNDELVSSMRVLLTDPAVLTAVARKNEFQLQDCWSTFSEELKNYPAWAGMGWCPSIEDCVACRVRTTGIQEESFTLDNISFKVFDVGGQRAERRKCV